MALLYTPQSWIDEQLGGAEGYDLLTSLGAPIYTNIQLLLHTAVITPGSPVNAARMTHIETGIQAIDKKLSANVDPITTNGISTAYTLVTPYAGVALFTGERFFILFHLTAGGVAPTLSRDGFAAKVLKYIDNTGVKVSCDSTVIKAGMYSDIVYDGTDYILQRSPTVTSGDLALKAPIANPTFTGTVSGITKAMVGLGNADNTSDVNKPVSTAQQAALDAKNGALKDGWISITDTWTYASANTVNVPTGAALIYTVGSRVKINQSGNKFFYITAVADTLLTLNGGSDYTVANSAISGIYFSQYDVPVGFPGYFNTPSITFNTGQLDNGTGGVAIVSTESKFNMFGNVINHYVKIPASVKNTATNYIYFPVPSILPAISIPGAAGGVFGTINQPFCVTVVAGNAYLMVASNIADNQNIAALGFGYSYLF